jgi:HSP20 family protein
MTKGVARRNDGIVRFDPWREMIDWSRTVEDMIDRGFRYTPIDRLVQNAQPAPAWTPNLSLYETPEEIVFTADLPGFSKDEIDLTVTAEVIRLTARHGEETQGETPALTSGESANGENAPSEAQAQPNGWNGDGNADQPAQNPQDRRVYYVRGQQRRGFSVGYRLPSRIDPENVRAEYTNGVLEVHMPKPRPVQPRRIPLAANGESGGYGGAKGEVIEASPEVENSPNEEPKRRQTRKKAQS